jgi:leader peptidase (prepilin peptidase) / N-methyltransferase
MLDALIQHPTLAVGLTFFLSLLVGSFLNVVIHRLPKMMELQWQRDLEEMRAEELAPGGAQALPAPERYNLMVPRSACPHCGHKITALENIPVLSWLVLRGKCSACGARISPRYPLVELITAGLSALAVAWFGPTWIAVGAVLLTWCLVALTCIDFDTQLLPDSLTLPLLWLGLLFNLNSVFVPLSDAVVGAMLGYLVLWSVYWVFKLVTGKEGMGYGDFKLLAALGAFMGWKAIPAIIVMSSVVGAVVGIALIVLARQGKSVPIAFGPYLAGAGLLTLYMGPSLMGLIPL